MNFSEKKYTNYQILVDILSLLLYNTNQIDLRFVTTNLVLYVNMEGKPMFEEGKRYNGFKYLGSFDATNVSGKAHYFLHRTKALVVYIEVETDKKCFFMGFRTPAKDDTGVTHIIEHSVLSGSKKYPACESLFHQMQHSLADDVNAFTANDMTCYHFSSRNEKDFDSLFDYYMDGIMNPSFLENIDIFLREGWHLENTKNGKVEVSGVVFNEMKAHMLNRTSHEYNLVLGDIFPGTCYQYESGGDICAIPMLSYDKVCDYYRKYYHPSNSVMTLYGKLDIMKYLKQLDEEFFAGYQPRKIVFKNYITGKKNITYNVYNKPVTMPEFLGDEGHDVWLTFGKYDGMSRLEQLVVHLLLFYFVSFNEHKVRYKMLVGNWAKEMHIFMGTAVSGGYYGVYFEDVEEKDCTGIAAEFAKHAMTVRDEGIDYKNMKILLKILRSYYLKDTVNEEYAYEVCTSLLKGQDPFKESLKECFDFIEDKLDNDLIYFSDAIEKYFIQPKTAAITVFKPMKEFKKRLEAELDKIVNPHRYTWSKKDKAAIDNVSQHLADNLYRSKKPTVSHLELTEEDIDTSCKWNDYITKQVLGKDVNAYIIPGSDTAFINLTFDISNLSVRETAIFSALSDHLFCNYTKKRSQVETSYQAAYFFEDYETSVDFSNDTQRDKVNREFTIKLEIKKENIDEALDLLSDVLINSDYSHGVDTYSALYWSMIDAFGLTAEKPNQVAPMVTKSHYSKSDNLRNRTMGPEACKYLYNLLIEHQSKKGMKELSIKAAKIFSKVFNASRLTMFVAGEEKELTDICDKLDKALDKLPRELSKYDSVYVPVTRGYAPKYEAASIASLVQYNALSVDVREDMKDFKGSPEVICSYIQEWIVHKQIREYGNAYGSNVSYKDGIFTFTSYRDPEVESTLDVFANAGTLLKKAKVVDFTKHKIAVAGRKNLFDSEIEKIEAIEGYVRSGKTEEDMKHDADVILETSEEDLKAVCEYLEKAAKEHRYNYYCIGNEKDLSTTRRGVLSKIVLY